MKYTDIVSIVAHNTGVDKTIVDKTYRAYWKTIRNHISSLPLKDALTDKEFTDLQPNVNIPSIGKFYVTLSRYKALKESIKTQTKTLK